MAISVISRLWELDLPQNKLVVLLAMADHASPDGRNIRPSATLIAWKVGMSDKQVRRLQHQLVADGILVEQEVRPGRPTVYALDLERAPKKPAYDPDAKTSRRRRAAAPAADPGHLDVQTQPGSTLDICMSRVEEPSDDENVQGTPGTAMSRHPGHLDVQRTVSNRPTTVRIDAPDVARSPSPLSSESAWQPSPSPTPTSDVALPEPHDRAAYSIADDGRVWIRGDVYDALFPDSAPALYPCDAAGINALIAMWWEWVPRRPVRRGQIVPAKEHFANAANREYAENLVRRGVVPADFVCCLGEIRVDPGSRWAHLREKDMTFCYAAAVVEEWVAIDRQENWYTPECPRITPKKPSVKIDLGTLGEGDNVLERLRANPDVIVDVPPAYLWPHEVGGDATEDESPSNENDAELLEELGVPL